MDLDEFRISTSGDFMNVVVGCNHIVGPWMARSLGTSWFPDRGHTIGLLGEQGLVAGAWFEGWNEASVLVHVVVEGRVNREWMWFIAFYPFEQLGVRKVLAPVESNNEKSRKWTEKYGFTLEATLKDAAPKGDLLIYSITKDQCKWLNLRKVKNHGEAQSAATA